MPPSTQQQRELDLAYDAEKLERDERRGLETRAATTAGALLVLVTVLATIVSRVDLTHVGFSPLLLLMGVALMIVLILLVLAVALARASSDVRGPGEPDVDARSVEDADPAGALDLQNDKVARIIEGNRTLLRAVRWATIGLAACVAYVALGLTFVVIEHGFQTDRTAQKEESDLPGPRGPRGKPGRQGPKGVRGPRGHSSTRSLAEDAEGP